MGLPGAGKTTLAQALAPLLKAVHFNADDVRNHLNRDLGFSMSDRIEQARRMSWLCDRVAAAGYPAIADFVCPTAQTRAAFGPAYVIWIDRISESRFADTNQLFVPPEFFDFRVVNDGRSALEWSRQIAHAWRKRNTAQLPDAALYHQAIAAGKPFRS